MVSLDSLSTEILLKVFGLLELCDLCNVKLTCRRFNDIIENFGNQLIKNVELHVTDQTHTSFINRCFRMVTPYQRLRLSKNWRLGIYHEKSLLYTKTKYLPWLQLDENILWISRAGTVTAYSRTNTGIDCKKIIYQIRTNKRSEVCRFVHKNNFVLGGLTNGGLWLWSSESRRVIFYQNDCHESDVNCVDFSREILVSGSRDNYVKIWQNPTDSFRNNHTPNYSIDLMDRVWAVSLCENEPLLAIGTAGNSDTSTLSIFDVVKKKVIRKMGSDQFGAGILDLHWESPSIVWSCGYDTNLRKWDLRTGNCEQTFEDPYASVVYCFQHNYRNSIISGTQNHGRAVLWDTRKNNCVQMYFTQCCKNGNSSPVYSLSFDAEFLFTVTDRHVSVLDFSVTKGVPRDYAIY